MSPIHRSQAKKKDNFDNYEKYEKYDGAIILPLY